jgi:hypothetical protein
LWRENFDTHPSHFPKLCTFSLNISIRPSKHLNYRALLTTIILGSLWNFGSLPYEI